MKRKKRRKSRRRRNKPSFQSLFTAFIFGLACSLPALSVADDLDEVIDDLMNFRSVKRAEAQQIAPQQDKAGQDAKSAKNEKASKLSDKQKDAKAAKISKAVNSTRR